MRPDIRPTGDVLGRVVRAAYPCLAQRSMRPHGPGRSAGLLAVAVALAAVAVASALLASGPSAMVAVFCVDAALVALLIGAAWPSPAAAGRPEPPVEWAGPDAPEPAAPEPAPAAVEPEMELPDPAVAVVGGPEMPAPTGGPPTSSVAGTFAVRAPGTGIRPEGPPKESPRSPSVPFAGLEASASLSPIGREIPWILERPEPPPPEAPPPSSTTSPAPSTPVVRAARAGAARLDLSQTPALSWRGPATGSGCVSCGRSLRAGPTPLTCSRCGRPLCPDCYWSATSAAAGRRCPECRGPAGADRALSRSGARRTGGRSSSPLTDPAGYRPR